MTDTCASPAAVMPAVYSDVLTAVAAAAPPGATFTAVGFDRTDDFLRAGYREADDGDMVIARGGECEFERARAVMSAGAKLILCPTHDFCAAAAPVYRVTDGGFARLAGCGVPFAAVFDRGGIDEPAAVFGEIAALDLCAFELIFNARMTGATPDFAAADEVARLVTVMTNRVLPVAKDRTRACAVLAAAGKKAAGIVARSPRLLHGSGAAQTAEAVRMLYTYERRQVPARGKAEFMLSAFVADFYLKNLIPPAIAFPPDHGRRMDAVCEYLGADTLRACLYAPPIYPPHTMRLCEYRLKEFRAELAMRLNGVKKRFTAAWRVFKRLHADDGYGLRTLMDRSDLGLCIALAPDVFAADTMLAYLRQAGALERYVI